MVLLCPRLDLHAPTHAQDHMHGMAHVKRHQCGAASVAWRSALVSDVRCNSSGGHVWPYMCSGGPQCGKHCRRHSHQRQWLNTQDIQTRLLNNYLIIDISFKYPVNDHQYIKSTAMMIFNALMWTVCSIRS